LAKGETAPVSGVILLDKPEGWTSRRAVNEVARLFGRVKAGHGGTLDPLATGMLPILLGEATRFSTLALGADKCYEVTLDLSRQTDTLDTEGETTARFSGHVTRSEVARVLPRFTGCIVQRPPRYSAVHVHGRRAYAMARRGEAVEPAARPVDIHALDLIDFSFPLVTLRVRCAKGAYVRALTRDIGAQLGMGGCVTRLRRVAMAGRQATEMVTFDRLVSHPEAGVIPLRCWLGLPEMHLDGALARRFLQGQRIRMDSDMHGCVAVLSDDTLLGTGEILPGMQQMVLHPRKVLPSAQRRLLA